TLLRAWKSVDRLQNPKAAKGWLFTILRRENARRFERKQLEVSDIPLETLESNDNYYDTSTEAFVLRRAIEGLPEEYREPLVQQVVGGYSQKEIANHLGITSAGVGTRLFRARNKLKEVLAA
ncbi:MAG: sigma-70 family RNA polymerase sigma factor, partial [Sedimenticola sp.]|nr:sigma-70 family RNA polymerase sigma factor [Sedimenticola sp.]